MGQELVPVLRRDKGAVRRHGGGAPGGGPGQIQRREGVGVGAGADDGPADGAERVHRGGAYRRVRRHDGAEEERGAAEDADGPRCVLQAGVRRLGDD